MAYNTVGDLLDQARILLQDIEADRYTNDMLLSALNEGLLETRRLRPDMYRDNLAHVPQYTLAQLTTPIAYEPMYRPALVNYVAGRVQLQDDEATNDARATIFLNTFISKLTGLG